jgi:hypothetical protein
MNQQPPKDTPPTYDCLGTLHQLLSLGPEDRELTKDPEMSFFYPVPIRSHADFAIENFSATTEDPFAFGGLSRFPLVKRGAYVSSTYLRLVVTDPNIQASLDDTPYGALYLVESVQLRVGGKVLDTIHPDHILARLLTHTPASKVAGIQEMVQGRVTASNTVECIIPIPFWFSREVKLPLYPLHHDQAVSVHVQWAKAANNKTLGKLFAFSGAVSVASELWVDMIEVAPHEVRMLVANEHKTDLITTHAYHTERLIHKLEAKIEIPFSLACKQLFWGVRANTPDASSLFAAGSGITKCCVLREAESLQPHAPPDSSTYHRVVQTVLRPGVQTPPPSNTWLFSYSFALYPERDQPSGHLDFSSGNFFLQLSFSSAFTGEVVLMGAQYNTLQYGESYSLRFS